MFGSRLQILANPHRAAGACLPLVLVVRGPWRAQPCHGSMVANKHLAVGEMCMWSYSMADSCAMQPHLWCGDSAIATHNGDNLLWKCAKYIIMVDLKNIYPGSLSETPKRCTVCMWMLRFCLWTCLNIIFSKIYLLTICNTLTQLSKPRWKMQSKTNNCTKNLWMFSCKVMQQAPTQYYTN